MNLTSTKITNVLSQLRRLFPHKGAMDLPSRYKTLVGVILSARTRDEQVLKLLPEFFKAFPDIDHLSKASIGQIRSKIQTIGMNNAKAKHLKSMAERVRDEFGGSIPCDMDDLVTLGGVGRKTASVLLATKCKKPAIAVDTHVHRVTNRLGWVKTKTPAKTEQALLKIVPEENQIGMNAVFVKHGRYICLPGRPRCYMCPLRDHCGFKEKNLNAPKDAEKMWEGIKRREKRISDLKRSV